jgi:hypothetical protein
VHEEEKDLGLQVGSYILVMQKLRDDIESLLTTPRDPHKRTLVVSDLEKIEVLHNTSENVQDFIDNDLYWDGDVLVDMKNICDDIRLALHLPAKHRYNEDENHLGLKVLLTKLRAAV